jgi:hypothetical protein
MIQNTNPKMRIVNKQGAGRGPALCRVDERLIRTVPADGDQHPTFFVIERLECGHKLTIYPKADPLTAKYRRCKQCEVAALPKRVVPLAGGNRGRWRIKGLVETLEDSEFGMASSMLHLIVRDSEESADESTGEHTLKSAIVYLHSEAQLAQSQNEYEDFSISLKLLGLLHDGWPGGPGILDVACGYLFELSHSKYLHRRLVRADFLHRQLLRCIPDYDSSNERPPEDDPTDGRKGFYGNQYTGRLCDLGTSAVSPDDASGIGYEDEDHTAAGGRVGDRQKAHDCQSVPISERAAGRPNVADDYRGSAPKRISSAAQIIAQISFVRDWSSLAFKREYARLKRREVADAGTAYFGA